VTSIAVAEIEGLTIGDRTSDNRCAGALSCVYIDAMRVEAFAQSNGQPGGSKAAYRLMFGRLCRRTFEPSTVNTVTDTLDKLQGKTPPDVPAHEVDQCLPDPEKGSTDLGSDVLTQLPVGQLNDFFSKPTAVPCPSAPDPKNPGCVIGITITTGQPGLV